MLYSLGDKKPELAPDSYVAPSADVIGWVRLASQASVWFGVVLRGDNDWIDIGAGTNIQDGSVMHTDPGSTLRVGANVTVGHQAFLHGCSVGDNTLIGNGAIVLDRARIGRDCIVAAGSLVPPDKVIEDGSVVMGAPGKVVRQITPADRELIARAGENYRRRVVQYRQLKAVQ
jgi:carbonic anhydrase/acetyltransferase-like protein (isoleucine patch superfamily)